jgi:dipeptidyl aminopeptidase/acylaminoacyl peptidase
MRHSFLIVILFVLTFSVRAQERAMTAYDVFKLKTVIDAQMSPDGENIAYLLSVPRPFSDGDGGNYSHLYVYNLKTAAARPFIQGKVNLSSIAWSIDGRSISFLSRLDGEKKTTLYAISLDGGAEYVFADIPYSIGAYELSPNGRQIAFTSMGKTPPNDFLALGFRQEVFEEDLRHINLYVHDLDKGSTEQITDSITVKDFCWSPDGRLIAAQVIEKNLTDYDYMYRELVLIDPQSRERTLLVEKHGKMGTMAFNPDGKYLAFVSGSSINDPVCGSLFVVPTATGHQKFATIKNLVANMELSVVELDWLDRQTLVFSSEEGCYATLSAMNFQGGKMQKLIEGGKIVFRSFQVAGNNIVLPANTAAHPNELFLFNRESRTLSRLTQHNEWLKEIKLGVQEVVSYKAADGLRIEGVLIYPVDYQPGVKFPCIVLIHGGPEASMEDGWQTNYSRWGQVAAGSGYFVFMPNYRASSGRGVKFSMLDYGKLGEEEFTDVLDGIEHLSKLGLIDRKRVGIGGGSYGGYFAALASTRHSEHFAASVVFVGISNQISKRNATDIPMEDYLVHWGFWTHENYDKVYKASPIAYATQNQTPTLILHGTADPRIHPSQSLELYRVLKQHGKAPVRLVWYPGEGHGNRNNPARLDYLIRTMAWFDYYLKTQGPSNLMPPKDILYDW